MKSVLKEVSLVNQNRTISVPASPLSEATDPMEKMRQLVQQMVGRRLPSERDLAVRLSISRPRLRAILATLQQEGLVEARSKSGTYVVDIQLGRLRRIVLLIDSALKLGDDPFFSLLVDALQQSIQAIGAHCLIVRTDGHGFPPPSGDGMLTLGLAGRAHLEARRPDDPPLVGLLLDREARPARCASVFQLDDWEAGQTAARYLLERGCRHLTFLGRRDIPASSERLAGIEAAVARTGGSLRFLSSHLNYADGLRLGSGMELPEGDDPIGIITTNDWLAVGLRAGLRHRAVPERRRVLLVSFDGLPVATEASLEIASLAVPLTAIATDAVAELQRLLRAPSALGRIIRYPLTWAHET